MCHFGAHHRPDHRPRTEAKALKHKRPKARALNLTRTVPARPAARNAVATFELLGETEWCINLEILRVVEQVWERGGGLAEIPRRANLALPTAPPAGASREEEIAHNRLLKKLRQQNVDLYGLRCNLMLQLAVRPSIKSVSHRLSLWAARLCPTVMPFRQKRSRSGCANAKAHRKANRIGSDISRPARSLPTG